MATTTAQVAMSMKEFEDVMEAIDRTTHARVAAIKTGSLDWELPTYTLPPSVRGSDPADVPPEAKQVAEAYVGDEKILFRKTPTTLKAISRGVQVTRCRRKNT